MKSRTVGLRPFRNILCPIDFSDQSRDALRTASELAGGPPARMTVLYVHDPTIAGVEAIVFPDASLANLRAEVKDFAAKAMSPSRAPTTRYVVLMGNPSREILRTATRLRCESDRDGIKSLGGFRSCSGIDDRPCGPPCRGSRARRQVENAGAPADIKTYGDAFTPPGGLTQRSHSCVVHASHLVVTAPALSAPR